MKRKIILFAMLPLLAGIITLQSCKKEAPVGINEYMAAMPSGPAPANAAIVKYTGATQTVTLTWTGTATNAIKWDVYFGTSSSPSHVASNVTTNSYTASVPVGGTYYWQVSTTDALNITTSSDVWHFEVNSDPAVPALTAPTMNKIGVSCTPTLTWTATDPENDVLTYDLIMDKSATPTTIVSSGLTEKTYTFASTLSANCAYYWQIIVHDPYGGKATGPIWKFTTGALPIAAFVGSYTCDEPAEGWTYPVNFTMKTATTLSDDSYWASWPSTFTLDFTSMTYSMPLTAFTTTYSAVESGVLDSSTGTLTGTYSIFYKGKVIEQGVHTYTKN
jgi:hypothetical protein